MRLLTLSFVLILSVVSVHAQRTTVLDSTILAMEDSLVTEAGLSFELFEADSSEVNWTDSLHLYEEHLTFLVSRRKEYSPRTAGYNALLNRGKLLTHKIDYHIQPKRGIDVDAKSSTVSSGGGQARSLTAKEKNARKPKTCKQRRADQRKGRGVGTSNRLSRKQRGG